MALTEYDLNEYWAILDELTLLATEDLLALLRTVDAADRVALIELLRETVPELVAMYRGAAVDNAMLFYESTQGIAPDRGSGLVASRVVGDQLNANMQWAVFNPGNSGVEGLLAGVVSRHILDGSRRYAEWNFESQGAGWFRAARPGACAFCRMLATRAATNWGPYTSADAAVTVGTGKYSRRWAGVTPSQYHNHCKCIPVRADDYEPPEYVNEWTETYYLATQEVGNSFEYRSILAKMREIDGSH